MCPGAVQTGLTSAHSTFCFCPPTFPASIFSPTAPYTCRLLHSTESSKEPGKCPEPRSPQFILVDLYTLLLSDDSRVRREMALGVLHLLTGHWLTRTHPQDCRTVSSNKKQHLEADVLLTLMTLINCIIVTTDSSFCSSHP